MSAEEKEQIEKEKKERNSEQLVFSAVSVIEPIDVLELTDVKKKLLMRQEEIKSKER